MHLERHSTLGNVLNRNQTIEDKTSEYNTNKSYVDILNDAGVLLASVDQSKTLEELQTNSAYVEYLSLIDQTVELGEQTISIVTEDETAPAGAEAQTEKAAETERTAQHFDFFRTVLRFLSKIMNYIVHLVKAR